MEFNIIGRGASSVVRRTLFRCSTVAQARMGSLADSVPCHERSGNSFFMPTNVRGAVETDRAGEFPTRASSVHRFHSVSQLHGAGTSVSRPLFLSVCGHPLAGEESYPRADAQVCRPESHRYLGQGARRLSHTPDRSFRRAPGSLSTFRPPIVCNLSTTKTPTLCADSPQTHPHEAQYLPIFTPHPSSANRPSYRSQEKRQQLLNEIKMLVDGGVEGVSGLIYYVGAFYTANTNQISVAMEFMDGGSVESLVARAGSVPEDVISRITKDVLEGLSYLHTQRKMARARRSTPRAPPPRVRVALEH